METSAISFQELAVGLGALKNVSSVSIPKIDAKNINSVINVINKFQTIDTAKIQPSINAIKEISRSMSLLGNLNFKENGLINAANALRRLSQSDIKNFDTDKLISISRSLQAFSTLPERTAAVVLFLPGFSADPGETDVFPSGYVLLFFLRFPPECFFRSFFVCLLDISVQLSFGNFKKSDRLMFPFVSLPIGIADFSSAAIIFKSRYLI